MKPSAALLLLSLSAAAQTPGGPAISGLSATAVTADGATVVWTTDRPADTAIDYGPTADYGQTAFLNSPPGTSHSVTIGGLLPGTEYHFRARSSDAGGASVSPDATLRTAGPESPPAPLEVSGASAADPSPPSVVIMNPAPSAVVSGTVTVSVNALDNVGVASVQLLVDGVEFGAPLSSPPFSFIWDTLVAGDGPHNLVAVARDAAGNSATSPVVSADVDNTPAALMEIEADPEPSGARIRWKTDQRADSQVEFGPTPEYGSSSERTPSRVVLHESFLSGLTPDREYHYRVVSRDAAGNPSYSEDHTFRTPPSVPAAKGAAGAVPAAATAKAPQRIITPARADGVNDRAEFGTDAKEVRVMDLQGRLVFSGSSPAPGVPISWNGRDAQGRVVESGVYLVRIETRDGRKLFQSLAVAK